MFPKLVFYVFDAQVLFFCRQAMLFVDYLGGRGAIETPHIHIYDGASSIAGPPPRRGMVSRGGGRARQALCLVFLRKSKENLHWGLSDTVWWVSVPPRCKQM